MFKKVLVTGCGVTGLHCIRAVKELGANVALLTSDTEVSDLCERYTDEVYKISSDNGSHPLCDTERLYTICQKFGADALHPGDSILAESAQLSKELEGRGVKFISSVGSGASMLADKSSIVLWAQTVGVPSVPRSRVCSNINEIRLEAKKIGFPIVLKPTFGTKGLGVKVVSKESQIEAAYNEIVEASIRYPFVVSRNVVCDKLMSRARLIEIVILRDREGAVVGFPSIDASLQRGNKAFVLDAPASNLPQDLIGELKKASLSLAEKTDAIGYLSFEFILQREKAFLSEVNTSLQPNYLALSSLTGVDLLKEQIKLILGEPLTLRTVLDTTDVPAIGHVISTSIKSEQLGRNLASKDEGGVRFHLPCSPGLVSYTSKAEDEDSVSINGNFIANLTALDADREASIRKLLTAFDSISLGGVKTNLALLRAILSSREFSEGKLGLDSMKSPKRVVELIKRNSEVNAEELSFILNCLKTEIRHSEVTKTARFIIPWR